MELRQFNALSNALIVAMGEAISLLGLNTSLLWPEMVRTMGSEYSKKFLEEISMDKVVGNDLKSIAESFSQIAVKEGLVGKCEVKEASDNKITLEISLCCFLPATLGFIEKHKGEDNFTPPCVICAILGSAILEKTNKLVHLTKAEYKPEISGSLITLETD
ncbi:MAG: hypothetical protein ACFFBD_14795 [Candidatus Hodarchaeota archaeon]